MGVARSLHIIENRASSDEWDLTKLLEFRLMRVNAWNGWCLYNRFFLRRGYACVASRFSSTTFVNPFCLARVEADL